MTERPSLASENRNDPLKRRLWLARAALAWEGLWPALWPSVAVLGVFAVVAFLDLLPMLPSWLHALVLAAFAGALGWSLYRARASFRIPDHAAGVRRLETASGMTHRPLTALNDRLAGGANDSFAEALWRAHRARMQAALSHVRTGWPQPGMAKRDPWAFRAALLLAVVVGLGVAGGDAVKRLGRALTPGVAVASLPAGLLDLWITPPAYTGLPPMLPRNEPNAAGEIMVPSGSALLAQVSGGRGVPKLVIDKETKPFAAVDAKAYRVAATLGEGSKLVVEQDGKSLGAWAMRVVPDNPPTIAFAEAPSRTRRAALKLDYKASDDYGLASVVAAIRRADRPEGVADDALEIPLPLPGQRLKEAKGSSYHDLTAHPWAGLRVNVRLSATDAAGQTGTSDEVAMVLPERSFQHPVARAIIEQRRALVADPSNREDVSEALTEIASIPGHYHDDIVVFLALRTASTRLLREDSPAETEAVQTLLWDTALRVEDGRLSVAERDLRDIQKKLQEALANNAPDEEIERLMQELQQAIDKYLQSLMEQAQRNPAQAQQPNDRNAMQVERRDLQRMLDQAREMARTGARDSARDMLAQLQEMLENLRAAQGNQNQQQGGEQAQQMMRDLQDLMQRQQGLTDRTFRRTQQGRAGQRGMQQPGQRGGQPGQRGMQQPGQQGEGMQGEGESNGDSASQEALREALENMMRSLAEMMGDVPGGFSRAERAMRDAAGALGRDAPSQALRPQMEAMEQLRSGARDLMQQLMQQMGEGQGQGDAPDGDSRMTQSRDPAGRTLNGLGGLDGRDVRIPEEAELQRSREILDELLRRAGERFRPELERNYIDRLLKRF
jgi:uncharacterized protein (TIGR02302 family)